MRVVLLATEGPTTWMVVNALRKHYPDLRLVLEEPVSRVSLLRGRLKRCGWVEVMGQLAFMALVPWLRRAGQRRVHEILVEQGLDDRPAQGMEVHRVASINGSDTRELLSALEPDVVILNGTRIVSGAVLAACGVPILNIHCGITPTYRGVHGGYWALRMGDSDRAGVTVHLVDRGIDTGGVLYQTPIAPREEDQFTTYPYLQYAAGIPLLQRVLANLEGGGGLQVVETSERPSRLHYHPTLWCYLSGRFRGVR